MNREAISQAVELIFRNEERKRDLDYLKLFFDEFEIVKGEFDLDFTIGKKENKTYLIFESTKSWMDWLVNLAFKPKHGVHHGFYIGFNANIEKILENIKKYKTDELLILGHSQGAAYALMCNHWYNFRHIKNIGMPFSTIVTGCPRVFANRAWRKTERAYGSIYRVENVNDIVTKIPPAWYRGYVHVGRREPIGKPKKWWKISVKDHEIENYLQWICKGSDEWKILRK